MNIVFWIILMNEIEYITFKTLYIKSTKKFTIDYISICYGYWNRKREK